MQKVKTRKVRLDKKVLIQVGEFLIGFILTRATMFNLILPIAVGYSCAVCSKKQSIYGGVGAFLGFLLLTNSNFKYAGAVLISIACLNLKKFNPIMISGVVTFIVEFLYMLNTNFSSKGFLLAIISSIISTSSTYFYYMLLKKTKDDKIFQASLLFSAISIISSCMSIEIFFGISVIRVLVVVIILSATYFTKVGMILSVFFGLAIDSTINSSVFTLGYTFASIISQGIREFNKTIYCAVFLIMYSIGSVFTATNSLFYISLYEVFIASLVFIFIPNKYLSEIKKIDTKIAFSKVTNQAFLILNELSKTFENSITPVLDITYEDIQKIYDKTVDDVCKGCSLSLDCWNKNYLNSIDAINQTSNTLASKGYVISSDYPTYFASKCINFPDFLSSVNRGIYTLKKNVQINERIEYNKLLISKQYKAVSQIISELNSQKVIEFFPELTSSVENFIKYHKIYAKCNVYTNVTGKFFVSFKGDNLSFMRNTSFQNSLSRILDREIVLVNESFAYNSSTMIFCEKDKYNIDIYYKNIAKNKLSGDNISSFTNKDSIFYSILADGMGSGQNAFYQSKQILNLLEKMLKSSVSCLKAIDTINPIMGIKNNDDSFVTLDLISIDLVSLDGILAKQGAMPTYVYRDKKIQKISVINLPLGMSSKACISRFKFKLNDIVIMISDGIENITKENLYEILEEKRSVKEISEEILKISNCLDDKTVITFKILLNK